MEVVIDKQYPVAAGLDAAWAVLSNINELATCMPGASITEQQDERNYKGQVRVKVGPAVAAFAGTIEVLELDASRHTLKMVGKGADKAGSSASMELEATLLPAEGGHSTLQGQARVIVSGKFAQFGGRMMTSVSDMILSQFAETFSQKAQALQGTASVADTAGAQASAPPATAVPAATKELNALALLWAMIRNFLAGLFGKKQA
jgi:carbon monoxide dehydrogenase subunit G